MPNFDEVSQKINGSTGIRTHARMKDSLNETDELTSGRSYRERCSLLSNDGTPGELSRVVSVVIESDGLSEDSGPVGRARPPVLRPQNQVSLAHFQGHRHHVSIHQNVVHVVVIDSIRNVSKTANFAKIVKT